MLFRRCEEGGVLKFTFRECCAAPSYVLTLDSGGVSTHNLRNLFLGLPCRYWMTMFVSQFR
jgi:hypothetical protein